MCLEDSSSQHCFSQAGWKGVWDWAHPDPIHDNDNNLHILHASNVRAVTPILEECQL